MALMLGMTACTGKNDVMPPTGGLDNAEKLIEGVYVGTWSSTNTTTGDVVTTSGSIEFASSDELGNNVVSVKIVSDNPKVLDLGAKAESSACNVSKLSSSVLSYWNVSGGNPFGFTFTGKVTPEGEATMAYEASVTKNHKQTIFTIQFVGQKQ